MSVFLCWFSHFYCCQVTVVSYWIKLSKDISNWINGLFVIFLFDEFRNIFEHFIKWFSWFSANLFMMGFFKNISGINESWEEMQDLFEFVIIVMSFSNHFVMFVWEFSIHSVSINIEKNSSNSSSLIKYIGVVAFISSCLNLLNNLLEWISFSNSIHKESSQEVSQGFECHEMFN